MSHPSEHEALLAKLEASRHSLSEEQLQQITGGCEHCTDDKLAIKVHQQAANLYDWLAQGAYGIGDRERFKDYVGLTQTASTLAREAQAKIDARQGTPGHPLVSGGPSISALPSK